MGMGGSYDTKTKQRIRELLWYSAFDDLIENEKKDILSLRYFCLPGAQCIELEHIFERYRLPKENIFAVEQHQECAIPIRRMLLGKGTVIEGRLEDLCEKDKLHSAFPFDIVNLDFCGQAFLFSGRDYQPRWNIVKYFLKSNAEKKHDVFYLLLTILGGRDDPEGQAFLHRTIRDLNEMTGLHKDSSSWLENQLIQEALPKIVIDEAVQRNYGTAKVKSYRYRQEGHRCNMVSFSFKLKYVDIERQLGDATRIKEKFCREAILAYYSEDSKELKVDD
jgi:hypothetical protein